MSSRERTPLRSREEIRTITSGHPSTKLWLNIFKLCSGNKQTFMRRMTEIANVARDLAASKMACSKKYTIFALTFKHDNVPKG